MTDDSLIRAIGEKVQAAGGDATDAEDLIRVWERVERDQQAPVARMRAEARLVRCCCTGGGVAGEDGRCGTCYGQLEGR